MARILFTTVCRDSGLYDYFRENAPENVRWRFRIPRHISFGLRFLRQNIPQLRILEYPTRAEFSEALKCGWDVVGFSFYLEETNRILEMAEEAHSAGVTQLWAGNYGALTPSVQPNFAKVFTGYGEEAVAQHLGRKLEQIQHPPLVVPGADRAAADPGAQPSWDSRASSFAFTARLGSRRLIHRQREGAAVSARCRKRSHPRACQVRRSCRSRERRCRCKPRSDFAGSCCLVNRCRGGRGAF